jgi:hypothetical protein
MKTKTFAAVAALAVLCLGAAVSAQCTFVDGSLSSLALTINGTDPSTVPNHEITVSAGGEITLAIQDTTAANTPFVLLAGAGLSCGSIAAGPNIGQIDIALPTLNSVVLDGINPFSGLGSPSFNFLAVTPFQAGFALPLGFAGTTPLGFQALYLDSSMGFFFRSTDAGAVHFSSTYDSVYSLADDGFLRHTLLPSTPAIQYGGVNYTQFWIGSNGVITFAAGDDDFDPTMAELFAGFQPSPTTAANPGVAGFYTDMNLLNSANGAPLYRVREDLVTGTTTVSGLNQTSWTSQASLGSFGVSFAAVTHDIIFDFTQSVVSPTNTDPILIGLSDGTSTNGGPNVTLPGAGWSAAAPTYVSPGNNTSVGFLYAAGAPLGIIGLLAHDTGTFNWTISIF